MHLNLERNCISPSFRDEIEALVIENRNRNNQGTLPKLQLDLITLRQQNLGPEITKAEEEYKRRDDKEKNADELITNEIAFEFERTKELIWINEGLSSTVS